MNNSPQYRINGFDQIKAFYSWVFNNAEERITPQHISLYLFLVNQNNRCNWIEWFKCPMDTAMTGSCIGNKRTYYACVQDMVQWNLIEYKKGANEWKSPTFKLVVLNGTPSGDATVPQHTPQLVPLVVPLPTPLLYPVYKQLTSNLKRITDNIEEVILFLNRLEEKRKVRQDFHPNSAYDPEELAKAERYEDPKTAELLKNYGPESEQKNKQPEGF